MIASCKILIIMQLEVIFFLSIFIYFSFFCYKATRVTVISLGVAYLHILYKELLEAYAWDHVIKSSRMERAVKREIHAKRFCQHSFNVFCQRLLWIQREISFHSPSPPASLCQLLWFNYGNLWLCLLVYCDLSFFFI